MGRVLAALVKLLVFWLLAFRPRCLARVREKFWTFH